MDQVEQNARICLLVGTWLDILDVAHVILCGDDRFILCADDHLSASFAKLYAIGQIAKQFIFISITPQESIPVRRNRRSCNHVLPLCVLLPLVDCFRMSVPDKIYSADSFKPRGDIRKKHLLGVGSLHYLSQRKPGTPSTSSRLLNVHSAHTSCH